MVICICRRVSDRDIARAVATGCASFAALQTELGVGTGCGKCRDSAIAVMREASAGAAATPVAMPQRRVLEPVLHP